jgi:hypothetical protein
MTHNCRVERSLSACGACSARAANEFARASLGVGRRGAAHAERSPAFSSAVPHLTVLITVATINHAHHLRPGQESVDAR